MIARLVAALALTVATTAAAQQPADTAKPPPTLPSVTASATVTPAVPARLSGFEARRAAGRVSGQFITREDIEKINPLVTTDLLRRRQALKIVDSMGVAVAVSTRGPKPRLYGRQHMLNCVMLVGLNGNVSQSLTLNSVPPADIYGIEIHTGATMPPEFGGARPNTYCGLIMIWSR
jgi:outer membrane receptor protein involved in Fe transport